MAQPVHPPESRSLWSALRASFRGEAYDVTTGSLPRAITILAIPMVLEMLMQAVFGVVDIFFVGRLGADAIAAVGLTESLLILVLALGMGLSMAGTALVARRIGEQDPEAAGRAALHVFLAGGLVAVPVSILGVLFAPQMLALMGATPSVIATGAGYCAVTFGASATILFLFMINAVFRGAGDAVLAMRALWIANGINIVLDPMLIFGIGPFPELGVTGAAVATAIGRGLGIAYQVHVLLGGRTRIAFPEAFRPDLRLMRRILNVSLPGMLQYLIGTASWLGLYRIVALFGSDAVAGYTVALRVLVFALLPSWGMGNAAATIVGQNLGAGQPDRAERGVWLTSFTNMGFLGLVMVGLLLFAEPLTLVFTTAPAVVEQSVQCMRIVSASYLFFAFGMVTVQAFNGAGDTRTPTWINFVAHWLIQIPLAWALAVPFGWDATGVYAAIAIAQSALALISVSVFRLGYWKDQAV
ncbi:MAG: MATE family efflux transporter [Bacteroidetes bacterium]|jgi:putative MATE family efflux protein|nr:MATE family efflux transporter [Bacteroidota bacterium]